MVQVIQLARANNVAIMLTQFAEFKGGPWEVRYLVMTGTTLNLERLSLLLQVCALTSVLHCIGVLFCVVLHPV